MLGQCGPTVGARYVSGGVLMKTNIIAKAALGLGAALVVLAFAPTAQAFASSAVSVPCNGPSGGSAGLITAINTLNSSGGGAINLRGCTYTFTVANNSSPAGANALPLITSPITINGYSSATLAGNSSTFRIFQVDAPSGNLTLNGLDITCLLYTSPSPRDRTRSR